MIPGLGKIPWRGAWQPSPVFLSRESPWTEDPGGLQSMGSQSWTRLSARAHTHMLLMRYSTSRVGLVTFQSELLLLSRSVTSDSCHPVDCSPPGFPACGISPARILDSMCLENWAVGFVFLEFTFLSLS